jgi:hypothetical protein
VIRKSAELWLDTYVRMYYPLHVGRMIGQNSSLPKDVMARMEHDRTGRRRGPDQERGLRPLHPLLPEQWTSKPLRVAMSERDWARFEAKVREVAGSEPTQARAVGVTITHLLDQTSHAALEPGPLDWMDWERRKTLRLLLPSRR